MQKQTTITLAVSIALATLLIGAGAGYLASVYVGKGSNAEQQAKDDLEKTVAAVGKLMVLPADEEPTLATVSDPSKLEGQQFFTNAKAGDKMLIYTKLKKVILYSPEIGKIIEVGSLNLTNQ